MLDATEMAKLLGRSLTAAETTNFDLYLNIATGHLEELTCQEMAKQAEDAEAEDRTFGTREGYRTVYVDIFTEVESVTVDGEAVDVDTFIKKQNDRFNGDWYNIVEFDRRQRGKNIVVNAKWGFTAVPADLQMLLALLFAQVTIDQKTDNQVKSKKIEDFTVTYKDNASYQELVNANSSVIDKYSQCNQGAIRHGRIFAFCNY